MRDLLDLLDRSEVSALITRYFADIDERRFTDAWVRSIFTDDVRLEFPIGSHTGAAGLAEASAEGVAPFVRTLHRTSDHVVEVIEPGGDRAAFRANLVADHIHLPEVLAARGPDANPRFTIGTYVEGEAVRTDQGWRIGRLEMVLVWTEGRPPAGREEAAAGRPREEEAAGRTVAR
ncbi:hypothetical protein ADK38_34415 [Streptomyces varsoviensis]|uniref:SnoaL-like domain-containing protein n=1 Tax=Streptomyces varsoviensis TaxID=67373 RepID=A0ABR5IXH9_9ACTN|nr:hypothetical protein ADK38_34415 [Streptomyces varsoviensis]